MRRDKITVAEQIRLRRAGFKVSDIARLAGVSQSTMCRRLQTWGVVPDEKVVHLRRPRQRKLDGMEDEVRRLHWEENLSTRQIADLFGVSKMAVTNFMHAREIEVRPHAEATALRFATNPPDRPANPGQFTSESARKAITQYWTRRRAMDRRNERRREQRRAA